MNVSRSRNVIGHVNIKLDPSYIMWFPARGLLIPSSYLVLLPRYFGVHYMSNIILSQASMHASA